MSKNAKRLKRKPQRVHKYELEGPGRFEEMLKRIRADVEKGLAANDVTP